MEGEIPSRQQNFATMTRRGGANDGGRTGGRARVEGYERKINKLKQDDGSWKTVQPGSKGSVPDSCLHRYARAIGFRLDDRDNEDAERSSAVAAAMQRINALTGDVQNRIKSQADFECFVFGLEAKGQQSQYLTFLRSIMEPFDIEGNLKWDETYEKVKFDPPSQSLVLTWLLYLRETRALSYGTIDGFLSGLSSTNGQYAGTSIDRKKIGDLMKQWEEQDKQNGRTKQAPTFDIVKDLPLLFIACFKIRGWEYVDCVIMWTAFLIMLSVIGRSSCMSKYCPLIEDIEFPDGPGGYDTDRLPKKVHIPWRNWKSRKNHVGEKYFITIGRNYTDSRFCPVFWLMYMLALKKKHGDPMTGPLFPIRKSENFQKRLKLSLIHI